MPNYVLCEIGSSEAENIWVYALDEWDAREQIATTLQLDAHNSDAFLCRVDARFKLPLRMILHASGEWTEVATPQQLRMVRKDDPYNPEV